MNGRGRMAQKRSEFLEIHKMELSGITPPSMCWDATNLPEQWDKFTRHTELIFSGPLKRKSEEEKVSYLLLWVGDKGRDIRHTWNDIPVGDEKKLKTFYERLKKQLRPTLNPIFARYQLYILYKKLFAYCTPTLC